MSEIQIRNLIPPFHSGENTYTESLREILNEYVEFVKHNVTTESYIIKKIENLNTSILLTISDIKRANSQEAYARICKFVEEEKDNINLSIYILRSNTPLIRLRYSESDLLYRKDIFHIPNNMRYKVSQQRYSITGVPCLYLSGCAFTAWLELNKPNFSNLWCSGFRANKEVKVLDLAIRLDSIINEKNNLGKLIFYPLVIATSYSTKHPLSPFREEYIISNILLQSIINCSDLSGIRYFSTKISNYQPQYAWMASNFVIPACNFEGEYDKDLCSSFLLTHPQPCTTLIHSPNIGGVSCMGMPMDEIHDKNDLKEGINHFEPRIFEWYTATQFFNIDGYLRNDIAYLPIECF